MKRLCGWLVVIGCRPPPAPEPEVRTLTVLAMNDWHAAFGERETAGGAAGGLPWLSAAVQARRAVHPELLLFDAGDGFQGDPAANATLGGATVDAFALLGVDAAAVGNHEFDHGPCQPGVCSDPHPLRGALRAAVARAPYAYLSANVTTAGGAPWSPPGVASSTMFTRSDVRVGVLGLTTADTPTTTKGAHVADLRFTDVVAAAERAAADLRADGAEVVVALAHVSGDCRDRAPDAPCTPDGELGRLLTELPHGTLDLIVAGHAHHAMQGRVGGTVFVETGAHGAALGEVTLAVSAAGPPTVEVRPAPLWELAHAPADPWCQPEVAYPTSARPVGGVPLAPDPDAIALGDHLGVWRGEGCHAVGCLDAPAARRSPGAADSPLGALVADALLDALPSAQVALQNAGGLRAELAAGPVVRRDVDGVMPFRDRSQLVELRGADLWRALEIGASGAHGLLLPAGLTYTVSAGPGRPRDLDGDGRAALWERARLCAVEVGGVPLDPSATYRVVVSDFLLGGGDHQALGLARGVPVAEGPPVAAAIEAWIADPADRCRAVPTTPRVVVQDCDPRP